MRELQKHGVLAPAVLGIAAVVDSVLYPAFFATSLSTPAIVLYAVPALVAAALAAIRVRDSRGHERLGWAVMLGSILLTLSSDFAWSIASRRQDLGYPNLLDAPYLVSYGGYICAVGLLTNSLWRQGDRRWAFDGMALVVLGWGVAWHFVIPQASSEGDSVARWVAMAYLLLDLCFLGTVLSGWYTTRMTLRGGLISLAALTFALGDAIYYFHPLVFDSTWTLGLWLIAVAAASPERELRMGIPRIPHAELLPYGLVAALGAVTAFELRNGAADDLLLAAVCALGLVVVRQIVTLRYALAEERRASAFRDALLETQSELGMAMLLLERDRVVFVNKAAEELSGLTAEELQQLPSVQALAFENERPAWTQWLQRPIEPEETRIARRDGSVADIEVVARWLRSPGEPRLLLLARDITQRKRSEQAVAQAQKFEGLGALAGGVAHDFNNLLSAVLGNVGLLRLGELDEEAEETVSNIELAASRGADLTRRLLEFARPQPSPFALADVRECLAETVALCRTAIPINVRLTFDPGTLPAPGRISWGPLSQAFLNLIMNARDAVGESGTIEVRLWIENGNAVIEVRDDGPGIDEATQRRMFEPFYTTKVAGAGTGLGLAITQRTVRDHGGTVEVESDEARGTAFRVYLPLSAVARAS